MEGAKIVHILIYKLCNCNLGQIAMRFVTYQENAIGQTIYVNAGFALLGLSYGQSSGAVTSRLDQRFRYTGAALTNDLAWLLGAGFAPLIVLFLSARYGLACVGLYLLSGAVATFQPCRLGQDQCGNGQPLSLPA